MTHKGSWGGSAHWPNGGELMRAASHAAKDRKTWIPLTAAALLTIGNADDSLSKWAADKQPVFGRHAENASDNLRTVSKWAYVATGLVAPSDSLADKARGFGVGIAAAVATNGVTRGLKSLTGRKRPNGQDSQSFPSGHASTAAWSATLAARNLEYVAMPNWARSGLQVAFHGVAAATGWARMEAEMHHVTDVLAGYALGHFAASFMHEAFLEAGAADVSVTYAPMPDGGALNFSMRLDHR